MCTYMNSNVIKKKSVEADEASARILFFFPPLSGSLAVDDSSLRNVATDKTATEGGAPER